eukprot:1134558-Pyramimonas_sp.AAC.1
MSPLACTWPAGRMAVEATPPPSSPAGVAGAGAGEGACVAGGFAWGSSWSPPKTLAAVSSSA